MGTAAEEPKGGLPTWATQVIVWVIFSFVVFSVGTVPIRSDNDCWWHVKSGKIIVEDGLPEKDVFTYTAADIEWHNHEWLAQVTFYKIHQAGETSGFGGWRALILFVSACLWATYAILLWLSARLTKSWWIALLIVVFAIAIGRRTFYPRPPVISYVFLAGIIALLTAYSEGWVTRRRWLVAFVPLIALWTNLHGAWMAGFVLFAAYGAQDIVELIRKRVAVPFEESPTILPISKWAMLAVGVVVASFLNPFGWKLYELPARVLSDTALVRSIGELRSPDFFFVMYFEGVILLVTVLGLITRTFRPRVGELLIYLFFIHQGLQHVRHLTLFGIAMVPMVSRLAFAAFESARAAAPKFAVPLRESVPVVAMISAVVLLMNPREFESYPARNAQFLSGIGYVREAYPSEACDLIELAGLEGRPFNQNWYAGYMIWRLAPERCRLFTDSRFDIFGGKFLADENAIGSAQDLSHEDLKAGRVPERPYWKRLLDEYEVQWFLIRGESGLGSRLQGSAESEWKLVAAWPDYGSGSLTAGWQVWIRDTPENAAQIDRATTAAASLGATPR